MHEDQNLLLVRLALIRVRFEHKLAALKRDGKDCFDRPVCWRVTDVNAPDFILAPGGSSEAYAPFATGTQSAAPPYGRRVPRRTGYAQLLKMGTNSSHK